MEYNYILIKSPQNLPQYILKVQSGSLDEILLVDMLFDNKVRFERSTEKEFQILVDFGAESGSISSQDLNEEQERQNPKGL